MHHRSPHSAEGTDAASKGLCGCRTSARHSCPLAQQRSNVLQSRNARPLSSSLFLEARKERRISDAVRSTCMISLLRSCLRKQISSLVPGSDFQATVVSSSREPPAQTDSPLENYLCTGSMRSRHALYPSKGDVNTQAEETGSPTTNTSSVRAPTGDLTRTRALTADASSTTLQQREPRESLWHGDTAEQ